MEFLIMAAFMTLETFRGEKFVPDAWDCRISRGYMKCKILNNRHEIAISVSLLNASGPEYEKSPALWL
jgi:hypothetical protein